MTWTATEARPSNASVALARNRLGVPAIVIFVMSAATPLTVVAGVVTTGYAVAPAIAAVALTIVLGAVGVVPRPRPPTSMEERIRR